MARGKKKEKALTPEEKLAQALVPESEHPYQIPENWCWVKLSNVVDVLNGFAFKSQFYTEAGIRIIRIANVQDGYVEDEAPAFYPLSSKEEIEKYLLNAEDLLLSLTGNVGRVAILPAIFLPAALNQRVACLRNRDILNKYFLFFFLLRREFQVKCIKNSKGSAQLNMSTEWLKEQPVCLPPFAEQQRIVDRVEGLFAKLDEAKEKAQTVLDGFETRKAAILHKAFAGELTAKWRAEHSIEIGSWRQLALSQCSSKIGDGLHGTPLFSDDGEYYFVNGNNFAGQGIEIKPETKKVTVAEYEKHKIPLFREATVFVSINGTLGKTAFYNDEPVVLGKSACYVHVTDDLNKFFLRYYFETKEFIDYANTLATGSTIKNLGLKAIRNLPLSIPLVDEQVEIVRILDSLFAKEKQAKEAAEAVQEKIDLLKKTILARAFRGELGTNDPTDEPAIELLKRIL